MKVEWKSARPGCNPAGAGGYHCFPRDADRCYFRIYRAVVLSPTARLLKDSELGASFAAQMGPMTVVYLREPFASISCKLSMVAFTGHVEIILSEAKDRVVCIPQ